MNNPMPDFRNLSIAERIQLVEDIWDSIAAEAHDSVHLSAGQLSELRRRVAAHEVDPSSVVPWETVRAELLNSSN